MKTKIALAAAAAAVIGSMSVLASGTPASAQATPVYASPAQARTDNDAGQLRRQRLIREQRGFDAFAAQPRGAFYGVNGRETVHDKHTSHINDY